MYKAIKYPWGVVSIVNLYQKADFKDNSYKLWPLHFCTLTSYQNSYKDTIDKKWIK